jgi:hypothetical protein
MTRTLRLTLALVLLAATGCPPERPVPLPGERGAMKPPPEEKAPPPPPVDPAGPKPLPDEKPVAPITSAQLAEIMEKAGKTGIIESLPHIKVFTKEKRIELEGVTSLKVGPQLELMACGLHGKSYESLLIWLCEPEHLHLALLFLGLEPAPQVAQFGQPGELKANDASRVVIEVSWVDPTTKKTIRRRVEDLLYDTYRDGAMKYAGFVFTGSRHIDVPQPPDWNTTKKVYAATATGTLAVTYHDPDAILDTPLKEGGNNTTFVAWADRLPERHTEIICHIRPWRDGDDVEPQENVKRAPDVERPPGGGAPH